MLTGGCSLHISRKLLVALRVSAVLGDVEESFRA